MAVGRAAALFCLLAMLVVSTEVTLTSETATNLQRLSRAHLEFALTLFREMTDDADPMENVVVSPYSVASVLSQLWLGTGEGSNSSEALESVLHYGDVGLLPHQVHQAFRSSFETLRDADYQSVVQTANAVFVQAGVSVLKDYESNLRQYYNSTVDELDFENGESLARSIINRWVSKQTRGHISKLLEQPLPRDTKLLLVNALALKALWKHSFDPQVTAMKGTFHQTPERSLEIPMMAGKFQVLLGSSSELNCRLLELPFRARRLSMFIILPDLDENSGEDEPNPSLFRLERNLDADNLKKLFATLKEETVQIRMPRFRISHSAALLDTLTRMGLSSVFNRAEANFTKISDSEELYVSAIAHKVVLEVREKGAQAAAATATGIERLGTFGDKFFEVNRPFVFFIWDYHSGALLFIGRVADPEPLGP